MTPPRLARWLLRRATPVEIRDEVSGELDAEFAAHALRDRGARGARRWYWRQALTSLPRLASRRSGGASGRPGGSWLREAGADLRYGARQLRQSPLSSAAAIITLALGLGATTAIFAAAYPVLLKPLPYGAPDRLVHVFESQPGGTGRRQGSFPDYFDWETARTLSYVAGYSGGSIAATINGRTERLRVLAVTDEFLEVLGVPPAAGRDFGPADMATGTMPVAILTHGGWQRRFGGAPVLGTAVPMNGRPVTIVGVLPDSFEFTLRGQTDLLLPYVPSPAQRERRYMHSVDAVARLADGVDIGEARAEIDAIGRRIADGDERYHKGSTAVVIPLTDVMTGTLGQLFGALGLSASLVALIAVANVAMLIMMRMRSRAREMSVRSALGASRGRLLRQLLAESLLLSAASGALALILARWGVGAAARAVPIERAARMPGFRDIGLTPEVMAFVAALVAAIAVGITLAAGWKHLSAPAQGALREDIRTSTTGIARRRGTMLFVAAQVTLAMVVLAGAALLVQSVRRLVSVSPGFEVEHLLTFRMALTNDGYATSEEVLAGQEEILRRLAAIPGVRAAGSIDQLPLSGRGNSGTMSIVGRPLQPSDEPMALVRDVSLGYFQAMGIPLLAGRALDTRDTRTAAPAVVVNRALADSIFEGRAVGQRIVFPFVDGRPEWEIVGIVGNEHFDDLDQPVVPAVYFAPAQSTSRGFSVVLRTEIDPGSLADDAAAVVEAFDPRVPLYEIATMEQLRERSGPVWLRKYVLWLVAAFASIALVLAVIGVYGVVGQSVAERRREFGIRLALGASKRAVMGMMLRQGATPVVAGIVAGLGGAVLLKAQMASLLFRAQASDGAAVVAAGALLAVMALVACFVPSRRAANTDPAVTLRS